MVTKRSCISAPKSEEKDLFGRMNGEGKLRLADLGKIFNGNRCSIGFDCQVIEMRSNLREFIVLKKEAGNSIMEVFCNVSDSLKQRIVLSHAHSTRG